MTAAGPGPALPRWALHPLAPALLLLVLAVPGTGAAVLGVPLLPAALLCVAGAAAGFANSGST